MAVQVRKVTTPQEEKAFFEFPWTLYKDDPNWIPPLLSMRKELLDKKHNPAWSYMEGDYFAAWRGDQIVGTITVFVNRRHNEYQNQNIAWFGTFESINDPEVGKALLDTAAQWAKERGYDAIRGPQSFTTHEECGLLVENFDSPVILMPYNPPYYADFITAAGFEKSMDTVSIYFDRQTMGKANAIERLGKLVPRAMERSNIVVRPLNPRRKKEEFRIFRDIYNAAWEKNWSFVPFTDKELDTLIASLGMFVEPQLAFFAEVDGEPAGFALAIPNLNEALEKAHPQPGVPEPWTLLKTAWHWKIRPSIEGVRLPLMGVKEQYRNRGVELAMFYHLLKAMLPSKYQWLDAGWILEINPLVEIGLKCGGEIYKRHRFYDKKL